MKKVLRGITWQDPSEQLNATDNLQNCPEERLLSLSKPEQEVLNYCIEFLIQKTEAPALRLVYDHFETLNKPDVITLLEEVSGEPFYTGASFKTQFSTVVEDRSQEELTKVLKEATKIATQGITVQGALIKGVDAAVAHLFASVRETPKDDAEKMPNSQKEATTKLKDLYNTRKNNPHATYGVMTGYGLFDSSTGGIRKKQLYLHAGFGGHLKSTLMLNMIVNAAVDGGWNPLLFSSEMPQVDLMYSMVAIHSANPKFSTTAPPLPSFRLLLGQLTPAEENFYDLVQDDLVNNPDHGVIRTIDAAEFTTFGSIQQRTVRENADIEVDILWVDYITRLPVDTKYRTMSITEGRNETIADAKRFAMSFNGGVGLAVCSPFQINREGYKKAKTSEGRMDNTALGQYNAAEKEADVITYIFFDEEEKAASEPKVGLLKSRWGEVSYAPISLFLEPDSRRIFDLSSGMATTSAPIGSGLSAEDVEL